MWQSVRSLLWKSIVINFCSDFVLIFLFFVCWPSINDMLKINSGNILIGWILLKLIVKSTRNFEMFVLLICIRKIHLSICLHLPLVYNQLWIFIYWLITWWFCEHDVYKILQEPQVCSKRNDQSEFLQEIHQLFEDHHRSAPITLTIFKVGLKFRFVELRQNFECTYVRKRCRYLAVSIPKAYLTQHLPAHS